jgi:uncharacterized membrane protein YbaN (DUF454 family)
MNLDNTSNTDFTRNDDYRDKVKRSLYFVFGTFFLILGGVGVFLPILPTTPFLLLSAACYYKSSKRMHHWMLNNRWFGKYLRNYAEGKGISLKAKLFTTSLLWILIIYSVFYAVNNIIVQLVLLTIAIGVTIHLTKIPTFKEK